MLVPVYNEEFLVEASLARLEVLAASPHLERVQVIVVDDRSKDGTGAVLDRLQAGRAAKPHGKIEWLFLRHEKNQGKGAAIRTALAARRLRDHRHPRRRPRVSPARPAALHRRCSSNEEADAVFGSRFAGGAARRVLLFRHQLGNKLLTFLCNMVTNLNLTDMETCYKAVRTDLLKSIPIVSNDFRLEPELTIKLGKRKARIFEIPISYSGRTYEEGKKINWRDGFAALWAIVRFALSDEIFTKDEYGSQILARLSRAPRFNAWMADVIRPYCQQRVLEIGSGVGNLTKKLIPRRAYVASDINPLYLQSLAALTKERPYLSVSYCDVTDAATFKRPPEGFDTVICLNVIEHVGDDTRGDDQHPFGAVARRPRHRPGAAGSRELRNPRRSARSPAPLHRRDAQRLWRKRRRSRSRR